MPGVPWQTIRLPQEAAVILSAAPRVTTSGVPHAAAAEISRNARKDINHLLPAAAGIPHRDFGRRPPAAGLPPIGTISQA